MGNSVAASDEPIPLSFPAERPLLGDELEALDCARLEPTLAALEAGLRSHWNHWGEPQADQARVWGLHGALGQGKSTVVRRVLQRLQDDRPFGRPVLPLVHGWNWLHLITSRHGHRRLLNVKWVQASRLAPSHLGTRLISRLVLSELVLKALPQGLLTVAVLIAAAWAGGAAIGWPDVGWVGLHLIQMAWAAVLAVPAAAVAWAMLHSGLSAEHEAGHLEQATYHLACWTGAAPDLVVLDDLDRATTDQQRAVLHALVRHTQLLRCPLVVCFDETEFLATDPDPEEPAELLLKLIQVRLRLPPRSREDAVLLAWGAVSVWHKANPGRRNWGRPFLHPVWVGHLARVMLVTGSVGPRRAKSLVAEVMLAAEGLRRGQNDQGPNLGDANALLLLAALGQIQPLVRRDPDLLLACLEAGGDADAWQAWAMQPGAEALFKWLDAHPRDSAHLQALLGLADLMAPGASGWRRLVLGRGTEEPTQRARSSVGEAPEHASVPGPVLASALRQTWFYDGLLLLGEALDALASGSGGSEALDRVRSRWLSGLDLPANTSDSTWLGLMWPLLVACLGAWPDERRVTAYGVIHRWLRAQGVGDASRGNRLQLWAVDAAALGSPDEAFWVDQLGRPEGGPEGISPTAFVVLKSLRRRGASLTEPTLRATWLASLSLDRSEVQDTSVAAALALGPQLAPATSRPALPTHVTLLALRHWPVLKASAGGGSNLVKQIRIHMQAVRPWLPMYGPAAGRAWIDLVGRHDALERPWSLTSWMLSMEARRLGLLDWLDALEPLCAPAGIPSEWSLGHWVYFLYHAPAVMGPLALQQQEQALFSLTPERWNTALCLLVQGWHASLLPSDRADRLWPALMKGLPAKVDKSLATALLSTWAESPNFEALTDTGSPKELPEPVVPGARDRVRFGALPLPLTQAVTWLRFLLHSADQSDTAALAATERCLLFWRDNGKTGPQADFYRQACDVAKACAFPVPIREI